MIEFRDIHKRFGAKVVLDGVSLTVERGQIFFVVGQSGAGKSVLVKHLIGLLRPDSGHIFVDGHEVTHLSEAALYPLRKRMAMVFQNSTLFDSMTLLDNVALPIRKHRNVNQREARALALEKLALVRMDGEAHRYPADFGDGMRKKVAIARALTLDPEVIIFDEPTTGIDPISANMIDRMIRRLATEHNVTSIVISHDLRSIFGVADRIAMLYKGKLLHNGPPEDFKRTRDPILHQFFQGLPEGPIEV